MPSRKTRSLPPGVKTESDSSASAKVKSKSPSPIAETGSMSPAIEIAKSTPGSIDHGSKRKVGDKPHGMGLDLSEPTAKRTKVAHDFDDTPALKIEVVSIPEPVIARPGARVKQHRYKLTYGTSPFPFHLEPTANACEEVYRILSETHGKSEHPSNMPPPSLEVAGCGEVPSLLDALMRTILSGNTSMENANKKLIGLKEAFGLYASGVGHNSIHWERVFRADRSLVVEATKRGGSQEKKTNEIQQTMGMIYKNNCLRYSALLRQKETGAPCIFRGPKPESREAIDAELRKFEEDPLTMHYVFEMSDQDAMEELIQYHGVGVKTAACVMLFCLQRCSFAVDTHVHRFCRWLGWVPFRIAMKNKEPRTVTENETFSHCDVRVPDHLKYGLHQLFIKHGQNCYRCVGGNMPGTPKWDECVCPLEHLLTRHEKLPRYAKPNNKSSRVVQVVEDGVATEEVANPKSGRAKAAKPRANKPKVLKIKTAAKELLEENVKVEGDDKLAAATDIKVIKAEKSPTKRKEATKRKPAARAAKNTKVATPATRKQAARGVKKAMIEIEEPERETSSELKSTDLEMADEGSDYNGAGV